MKKIKMYKNYGVFEQTEKEIKNNDNHSSCKYLLITPEEMEQPSGFRDIEFDADNIQELIDFIA